MRYVSTRGRESSPSLDFSSVLLAGLAPDGGLYLPETWVELTSGQWRGLRGADYAELAAVLMAPYASPSLDPARLRALCQQTYSRAVFRHPAVAPLVQVGPRHWLLELFHGPTLAFKDFALQLVGRLFDEVLAARDARMTVVGATSGDTGSAAIEACRALDRVDIFILHPHGRVSEVQRRQMTTVAAPHVHNLAVRGTFDDCQDLVKALFADAEFRSRTQLSAVNSINWARVLAQVVYYAWAALALGAPDREVRFCVPTGNFGNVFAGWVARRMGLPIGRLIVASNRNDILTRFLQANDMRIAGVEPSLSPSMDIQISSNFERLMFEISGRNSAMVASKMAEFRRTGTLPIETGHWNLMREIFVGERVDDAQTVDAISRMYAETGLLVDPHTAVGVLAAVRQLDHSEAPIITLSTAHPAKFPDAVARATRQRPPLPAAMADIFDLPERYDAIEPDLDALKALVLERSRAVRG